MSDLQIWLLLTGAAAVAALLVFNWIQERRFRKEADAAFRLPDGDALASPAPVSRPERVEPALRDPTLRDPVPSVEPLPADAPAAAAVERVTRAPAVPRSPAPDPVAAAPAPAPPPTPAPRPPPAPLAAVPYDELIEYRVRLGGDSVPAGAFADAYAHARTLGKPVRWQGLAFGTTEWEDLQPWRDVQYQQVGVTMQLADRNGAVQGEQLDTLCAMLQATAQTFNLRLACDDVAEALVRAQAIDQFCVDVDVLIGLNVVARGEGVVDLARIVREAEGGGMVLSVDGVFQLLDSRGEPLYALCNHDAEPFSAEVAEGQTSQGVTLQFDVPRVPDGLKVFDGMVTFGRRLANEVGGILVDDNLRPLTDAGIEKIRTQLMHIYERMEARGVPSGSRRALRLFS